MTNLLDLRGGQKQVLRLRYASLRMTAFFLVWGGRHFGPNEQRANPMESVVPHLFILGVTCDASQDAQDDNYLLNEEMTRDTGAFRAPWGGDAGGCG